MDYHLDKFSKLLQQIMKQDLKSYLIKESIDQAVCEMEVLQLVGDSYVVWLNWLLKRNRLLSTHLIIYCLLDIRVLLS